MALEAGIPPGVLNVVTGPGGTVGASIAAHDGIGKVAFTGETITGQETARLAASNVKKISLELGGKSLNVVFADADLGEFAREAAPAVRQLRPGLHGAEPDHRRALGPRPGRRAVDAATDALVVGDPGRRDAGRVAGEHEAARARRRVRRSRHVPQPRS